MNKMMCAVLLGAGVLAGCASTAPREIPVVESGTRLSPGTLRDVGDTPVVMEGSGDGDSVVTVMTPPEAGIPAIASGEHPATPISVDSDGDQLLFDEPARAQAEPSSTVASATRVPDAPVQALLNTAQQQRAQGDLNGAASSLERALRIAPQEPQVLYRLSEIRLMQGDLAQAEQLAQRGLSYSSGRPALQAGLWDLIAEAREKQGNSQGAAEARQKARAFM